MFETALCKFLPGARRNTQRMAAGYILDPPWGAKKKLRANPLRGGNHMFRSAIRLCLTTAGCLFIAAAQDQPAYVRDACVKVAPGKSAEYAAMLRDVTAKQMRVRIDDGHAAWWLALSSVVQDQPAYVRDACVKVAPGKSAEYAAMLQASRT